jgi:hypothetical protein
VNSNKPIYGDPWGYALTPSQENIDFLINNSNIIYNDNHVYLLNFIFT